jgi:hypothetical protein
MAIDETGQNHSACCVDFDGFPCLRHILQTPTSTHFNYNSIAYQDRAIRYYTQISCRRTTSWFRAAAQSQQLARAPD